MTLKSKRSAPKKTAKKKASASAIEAPTNAMPDMSGKNILVVDDDPALSRVMALKFSSAGFNVTVCHNGAQAIEAMGKQKFDGIILDLIMPEKTGFDVLTERPHTLNAHTPTFVMTDMRTQETAEQVKSLGAADYFVKMQMPLKEVIDIISQSTQA